MGLHSELRRQCSQWVTSCHIIFSKCPDMLAVAVLTRYILSHSQFYVQHWARRLDVRALVMISLESAAGHQHCPSAHPGGPLTATVTTLVTARLQRACRPKGLPLQNSISTLGLPAQACPLPRCAATTSNGTACAPQEINKKYSCSDCFWSLPMINLTWQELGIGKVCHCRAKAGYNQLSPCTSLCRKVHGGLRKIDLKRLGMGKTVVCSCRATAGRGTMCPSAAPTGTAMRAPCPWACLMRKPPAPCALAWIF